MSKRTINRMAAQGGLVFLGLLTVLALGAPAVAGPQIMSAYGDQLPWYSAEINAMGGTGAAVYRGGISNIFNPAFLAREKNRRLDLGFSLDQAAEDRFQPLFDNFQNLVTDVAIASNRQQYWQTGFGFASRVMAETFPLTVGVSLTDRNPFSYTFEEELRSPLLGGIERDQTMENRLHEVTGTLRNFSVGFGLDLNDRFSAGLAGHYAFGTRKEVHSMSDQFVDVGDVDNSYRLESKNELNGVNWTLGLRGKISERVEVGLAWETQLKATGSFRNSNWVRSTPDSSFVSESSYDGTYRYPNIYRAGLTFLPRTDPRTIFSIELEYKPWSEMFASQPAGGNAAQNLADVTDVRVGLEHMFYNGMPLRFGFRYIDAYADSEASASVFSAGVGVPFGGGMFAASLELSKLTSIQDHIFGYPTVAPGGPYFSDPQARVEDTRFRVGAGYTLNF